MQIKFEKEKEQDIAKKTEKIMMLEKEKELKQNELDQLIASRNVKAVPAVKKEVEELSKSIM